MTEEPEPKGSRFLYSPTSKAGWMHGNSSESKVAGGLSVREQLRLDKQLSPEADLIKRMRHAWEKYEDCGEEDGFVMTKHDYTILGELIARLDNDGSIDTLSLITELASFLHIRDKSMPVQKFREACGHRLILCAECHEYLPTAAFTHEGLRQTKIKCLECIRRGTG